MDLISKGIRTVLSVKGSILPFHTDYAAISCNVIGVVYAPDLRSLLKSKHVQGLELHDAHKTLNRTKVVETVEAVRSAITSAGGGPLFLALPAHPELLAKYYDLRTLVKKVDMLMVETHALGLVKKMTYHPSRLSGVWDMMNTDSVVDLVIGLGVPSSKIVISLPATARQFTLVNETLSTPGSPTEEDEPKEIDQAELCRQLRNGRWTLERDQDLSAPYAFKNKTWISFEDSSSIDVKGKYARVRGLAGIALHRADRDVESACGPTLRASLAKVLNQQSRAPRAAVLRSLENEILSAQGHVRALDALQVSPYRITQVVDSDGVIHSIREDTRTEFSCSRQGYFVHPRSCARFYRCVKFDQLSPEYTVFEFDCPAGLAFDSRYEVCVWPGSLPHSQACPGSSEIAPVPRTRFICPEHEGYYADPENCRWFFACLDHGKSPLTAYEFRCPFGLGFDAEKLKCDWPWVVPACGNIGRYEAEAYGFSAATLTGAAGYQGQTADAINVAAHQSLVSGASLNNLVGIQGGFLTKDDALDSNFIASQELANAAQSYEIGHGANQLGSGIVGHGSAQIDNGLAFHVSDAGSLNGHVGLVQPAKYSSGSIILDDYRLPTKEEALRHGAQKGNIDHFTKSTSDRKSGAYNTGYVDSGYLSQSGHNSGYASQENGHATVQNGGYNVGQSGYLGSYNTGQGQTVQYQSTGYDNDNSGAYVHDPTGDYAEPYKHVDSPVEPYVHDDAAYKQSGDYYDYGKYSGSSPTGYEGKYVDDQSGQYVQDNAGAYVETGRTGYKGDYSSGYTTGYTADSSGAYKHDDSGKYKAGVYRVDGHIGEGKSQTNFQQYHEYSGANAGNYISDSKAHTGTSHILTAGAINVGLVGKTTLIDDDYNSQANYQGFNSQDYNQEQGSYHGSGSQVFSQDEGSYQGSGSQGYSQHQGNYQGTKSFSHSTQTLHPAHVSYVSQPAVAINHVGTDGNNLDGYSYVTTPTSSGIPTTATPFAVTSSIPTVTYKTTFVPEAPKTTVKQIFGISQPAVTYVQPTAIAVKQVTPQVHVTDHNQGLNYQYESKDYSGDYNGATKVESGYDYSKPSIKFEEGVSYTTAAPAVSVSTYQPESISHNHQTVHQVESVGFGYSTPTPAYEEPFKKVVAYTTGPSVATYSQPTAATYTPHSFSHQTIHKVESSKVYTPSVESASVATGYDYSKSTVSFEEPKVVQYTTARPTLAVQPVVSTYQPQVISHQTVHKVEANRVNTYSGDSSSGYTYEQPSVKFEEGNNVYSTPAPIVSSTYQPQTFSHQTVHLDTQKTALVSSTPKYEVSYQSTPVTVYENPILKYTQKATPVTYVEPVYKSQAFSHQTIHKVENNKAYNVESGYEYSKPAVHEQVQYTTAQPAVVSTYQPQVFSQQTLHNVDASQVNTYTQQTDGYEYKRPAVKFEEAPKTVLQYSTPSPVVASTYRPQTYSHQTIHKVESQKYVPVSSTSAPQVDLSYQQAVTTYENPILKYSQKATPVTYVQPTAAVFTQTYKPLIQQHEVKHIVSQPAQYQQQQVHLSQEGYSYSQPEIQRDVNTYSDASAVSHQVYHQSNVNNNYKSGKDIVFVSTSPSTLVYEDHYVDYESPKEEAYQAPEYIPPKNDYKSYSVVSTASTPVVHQSSVVHKAQEYVAPKVEFQSYSVGSTASAPVVHLSSVSSQDKEYDTSKTGYKSYSVGSIATAPVVHQSSVVHQTQEYVAPQTNYKSYSAASSAASNPSDERSSDFYGDIYDYSQQYESVPKSAPASSVHEHSFSTSHAQQPQKVESIHFSSFPSSTAALQYQQVEYQSPEIQVVSKGEEYLPPVVSTTSAPVVTSTYRPRTYSTVATTREYLPPAEPKYEYVSSTTARPIVKVTTPAYRTESTSSYKASEYLPPADDSKLVNFESFGFNDANADSKIQYNPYQQFSVAHDAPVERKHNIVVETAKSHLLGFGTVGPDAGLVSPVTYTTSAPVVSSTYRQRVKSTSRPAYKYSTTTEYQAPEYLPPSDDLNSEVNYESNRYNAQDSSADGKYNQYQEISVSTSAPVQRKQNIVIQTAKSQQFGFGAVPSDAGLVKPVSYTTSAPIVASRPETYSYSPKTVTSTYAPVEQGLFEVVQPAVPVRRTKPKVAVVTKINDFNPFLVRKLGAVCSCQSPILILKGKRPQHIDNNDYDDSNRGDIRNGDYGQRYTKVGASDVNSVATAAPIVTSTFNPIIVPDDSFYHDYQDQGSYNVEVTPKPKAVYSESYVSSTPVVSSTTERYVRVRPRVKAVTAAPTYKTVLLNQEVAPAITIKEGSESGSAIESQAFDRYGPGGWRSRDETLQGSVDCQRAGLFRHPKQCNKFYACRWDCTKQRFTLHVFNCPVQLSFDPSIGACNWPSQGPACQGDTLLTNVL
uniref:Chitinase n=1 Tax=Heliothis virescens TaxID=7102 RepID=A0A2A4JHR1_HELVI